MIMRITPMKVGNYIEPCMLSFQSESSTEFYPSSIVHVDTFWQGQNKKNEVYNLLREGQVVEIEFSLDLLKRSF